MQATDSHDHASPEATAAPGNEEKAAAASGITSFNTMCTFWKRGPCSTAMMSVLDRAFDHPLEQEERGAMPLAGGIAQQGYQCGMLWGATLAAGALAHACFGPGPRAEAAAVRSAGRLVESFKEQNGSASCLEITDTDWTKKSQALWNFLRGGPITCTRMSAKYAPVAFEEIQSALSEEPAQIPCSLASCAAVLAKKIGMPDLHVTMAAGLAGGIGLSGGACGALGAATWAMGMDCASEGLKDYAAVNARALEMIDLFLKNSDYEFECSAIVGKRFHGVNDHAAHLAGGGCSKIIERLARAVRSSRAGQVERLSA